MRRWPSALNLSACSSGLTTTLLDRLRSLLLHRFFRALGFLLGPFCGFSPILSHRLGLLPALLFLLLKLRFGAVPYSGPRANDFQPGSSSD